MKLLSVQLSLGVFKVTSNKEPPSPLLGPRQATLGSPERIGDGEVFCFIFLSKHGVKFLLIPVLLSKTKVLRGLDKLQHPGLYQHRL